MKIRTGLNPYGLTYYLGLQGKGTDRANPNGKGLDGFLDLATELEARVVELPETWLGELDALELAGLHAKLDNLDMVPVISSGLQYGDVERCIVYAQALGATYMRFPSRRSCVAIAPPRANAGTTSCARDEKSSLMLPKKQRPPTSPC